MKRLTIVLLLFFVGSGLTMAQLDQYRYFIVPKQFKAFNKPNEYKTSTLVKYLLINNGMEAAYEDAQPADLIMNPCTGLYLDLIDYKKFLTTEVELVFKDCKGKEVFRTQKSKSSIKEFEEAYDDAIRKAFSQIEAMGYEYNGGATDKAEIALDQTTSSPAAETKKEEIIWKPEQARKMPPKIKANFKNDVATLDENKLKAFDEGASFRVENVKKETQFYISPTLVNDVYLIQGGKEQGIVFKKNGKWFMEVLNQNGAHRVEWIDLSFQN